MKKWVILPMFLIALLLVHPAIAQRGTMKLLAVSETEDGFRGGIANLFLEVKPGSGRVFLETFPLTRVDTQVSTRLAKEIACDFADVDCGKYDFFYTITADSSIIAGPSAGSAISILTFSLIKGVKLDENVAITGTINSGGLIGPVGGLKAKVDAASRAGLKKVLVPIGETIGNGNSSFNETLDLEDIRKKHGIEVLEVSTLDEAIFEFTGKRFREKKADLKISEDYKNTMKLLAEQLCSRSRKLEKDIIGRQFDDNRTKQIKDNALNLSLKGKESYESSMYYSSASYCFGANVELSYLSMIGLGYNEEEVLEKINELNREIKKFDRTIEDKEIKTITDLESYMVVKERLLEASDFLSIVLESIENQNASLHNLAYAIERVNSAKSWSTFLGNPGKEFDLNPEIVKNACKTKLSEVEERIQYVQLSFPQNLDNTRKEVDYAYRDLEKGNYELCLFKASKAKANVDTILSVLGVRRNDVDRVIQNKIGIVERNIVEETEKGIFPILGYSYYEYANSLKESDPFSALLYSGYALELSNLEIYLKNGDAEAAQTFDVTDTKRNTQSVNIIIVLIIGIVLGILLAKICPSNKIKGDVKRKAKRHASKKKG
jgi:uncharacterized protein